MTTFANTDRRYGAVAMALHWLVAILIVGLVALGLYMVRLPDVGFDTTKIRLILYHKEVGILVLGLVVFRLAWRFGNVLPKLVEGMPVWQQVAARYVHLCFYALMLAQPITGWLMSSAAGIPVSFFHLGFLPDLIGYNDHHFQLLRTAHQALGYTLIPFIAVHAGAALQHHFVARDDTLRHMLPEAEAAPRALSRSFPARSAPRPSGSAP